MRILFFYSVYCTWCGYDPSLTSVTPGSPVVFPSPSVLTEDAVEGVALGAADVAETILIETKADAAVAVDGDSSICGSIAVLVVFCEL